MGLLSKAAIVRRCLKLPVGPRMDTSDLDARARGLLDFALQSVEDGLQDQQNGAECFIEADNAIRILQKILVREDEFRHAQLALLGLFDASFMRIFSNKNAQEREQYLKDALERIDFAKTLFP